MKTFKIAFITLIYLTFFTAGAGYAQCSINAAFSVSQGSACLSTSDNVQISTTNFSTSSDGSIAYSWSVRRDNGVSGNEDAITQGYATLAAGSLSSAEPVFSFTREGNYTK